MKKPALIISACLVGRSCRYDGASKILAELGELEKLFDIVPVCPETDGGLSVPRPPAEIINGKIITADGEDVTGTYEKGARNAVVTALRAGAKYALLKESSPSCGTHFIYDGTFSGRKISGEGIAARALRAKGIKCYSENTVGELLCELQKDDVPLK